MSCYIFISLTMPVLGSLVGEWLPWLAAFQACRSRHLSFALQKDVSFHLPRCVLCLFITPVFDPPLTIIILANEHVCAFSPFRPGN
ncbi:hypothetical protein EDB87DRAFT_1357639 [Lactarius vividus]|nr:hypothetical protein EDB87DRAFT_1357639 [Lactarius vividus]